MDAYLAKEVSLFGVIPKRNQLNKWGLIVDLSSPEGHTVNDAIQPWNGG